MTQKRFNEIVDEQCNLIKSTLVKKQNEYNFTGDRLDSFKKAAALENITPVKALEGYLTKHIISLYDMMNSSDTFTKSRWAEKMGDTINYLILLKAVLEDTDNFKEED